MPDPNDPGVTLSAEEVDSLCDALTDYTANRAAGAPDRFDKHVVPTVARIVAERERKAREEGFDVGWEAGWAAYEERGGRA